MNNKKALSYEDSAFLNIKFAICRHDVRCLRATVPFPNVLPLRNQLMEFPQRAALWDGPYDLRPAACDLRPAVCGLQARHVRAPTLPHYGGR